MKEFIIYTLRSKHYISKCSVIAFDYLFIRRN
uniref:Uncharacterized protein n=1 Tax=Anguilla anguilla TaxID=7936 RepID=A0A0E9R7H9_ANGAN